MRIFVAGGTGVLGRRVVPALVARGHDVTVAVRSAAKAEAVLCQGARAVEVSLFEPPALATALAGSEVVVNLATSIPPMSRAARARAWEDNHRLRRTGSANLVDAARTAGAVRFVQESVTFLYEDGASGWIAEDHPVRATSVTASALDAEAHARDLAADGAAVAVILRFAALYGPDSGHTVAAVRAARLGVGAMPGPGDGYVASVTTDDAASAVVAAALGAPSGTYNVGDDEPVTRTDHDRVLAAAVGRGRLRAMPAPALRLLGDRMDHFSRSHRVSNAALRAVTGWAPATPSVREGIPAVVAAIRQARGGAPAA